MNEEACRIYWEVVIGISELPHPSNRGPSEGDLVGGDIESEVLVRVEPLQRARDHSLVVEERIEDDGSRSHWGSQHRCCRCITNVPDRVRCSSVVSTPHPSSIVHFLRDIWKQVIPFTVLRSMINSCHYSIIVIENVISRL
jgi:hypothetical protein